MSNTSERMNAKTTRLNHCPVSVVGLFDMTNKTAIFVEQKIFRIVCSHLKISQLDYFPCWALWSPQIFPAPGAGAKPCIYLDSITAYARKRITNRRKPYCPNFSRSFTNRCLEVMHSKFMWHDTPPMKLHWPAQEIAAPRMSSIVYIFRCTENGNLSMVAKWLHKK